MTAFYLPTGRRRVRTFLAGDPLLPQSQATAFVSTHRLLARVDRGSTDHHLREEGGDEPVSSLLELVAAGSRRALQRGSLAAAGAPVGDGRFLVARVFTGLADDEDAVVVKAIELDARDYAALVAAGLWTVLDEAWLWDSPSFEAGLPMPISFGHPKPASPNDRLESARDRLIELGEDRGVALVDDDAARSLMRVLRRLSEREAPTIGWSIGLDPPPPTTRLCAGGPAPDGHRWHAAVPARRIEHSKVSASDTARAPRHRLVAGGVPNWLVVLAATLAAVSVLAASAAWIARPSDASIAGDSVPGDST